MADQLGRVLGGRYRLLAPIGTGASAHVFLAEDVSLRRRVAVKVLHAALAHDEAFLRRFRAEAQAAAALSHPNIMAVFDWGEDDDGPYLVLEHLSGGSLRSLLDEGHRLSPSQALGVGLQAARGLDYAHRRGFVHRDIKPANLLFDDEGRLCIADFGLARALAEAAWTEPAGAVVGSARYASPEQARGASLDGKSDVYSLALVLVEAVTGVVPFAADTTIATLMARVDAPLVAPPELGALGPVVERAGVTEPEKRPDAARLGHDLDRAARELPAPDALPLAGSVKDDGTAPRDPDMTALSAPALFDQALTPHEVVIPERRKRWPLLALLVGLVLAIGAAAAYAVVQSRIPTHAVPNVVSRTEAEARTALRPLHVNVVVRRQFVDSTKAGVVLDQDPSAGAKVKEHGRVRLTVSKGPPLVAVPLLASTDDEATARAKIEQAGLTVGTVQTPYSEDVPKGRVLDWSPKDRAPKGTPVNLVVSNGPPPRQVPVLAGKTFDDAKQELEGLQLHAQRNDVFSDTVQKGQVVSTSPPAGADVPKDAKVTVNVSKGPDVVTVPNVVGKSAVDAEKALNAAGLVVSSVSGPPTGTVFATSPPAGTQVHRGSGVILATKH